MAKNKPALGRPVVVATEQNIVCFGYAENTEGNSIELKRARLAVYWSADVRGFAGLAASGPNKNCRIGPPVDMEVRNVTCVVEASPEAVAAWERGFWS